MGVFNLFCIMVSFCDDIYFCDQYQEMQNQCSQSVVHLKQKVKYCEVHLKYICLEPFHHASWFKSADVVCPCCYGNEDVKLVFWALWGVPVKRFHKWWDVIESSQPTHGPSMKIAWFNRGFQSQESTLKRFVFHSRHALYTSLHIYYLTLFHSFIPFKRPRMVNDLSRLAGGLFKWNN